MIFLGETSKIIHSFRKIVASFFHDESGSITAFMVVVLTLIVFSFGIAIDLAEREYERKRLNFALDNALLSAATTIASDVHGNAIPQETIFLNQMAAAGFSSDSEHSIIFDDSEASNGILKASGSNTKSPFFIHLLGFGDLTVSAKSAVSQKSTSFEVAIVMDISTSMRSGTKMPSLRSGATAFINAMNVNSSSAGHISLIPFAGPPNLPKALFDNLGGTRIAPGSSCVQFDNDSDFNSVNLPNGALKQYIRHSVWPQDYSYKPFYCINETALASDGTTINYGEIVPWSKDKSQLLRHISALQPNSDGTSQHQGMKWAITLLNDSARVRSAYKAITSDIANNIPTSWNDETTKKVIVMMSDGVPYAESIVPDQFRGATPKFYFTIDPSASPSYPTATDGRRYFRQDAETSFFEFYAVTGPYQSLDEFPGQDLDALAGVDVFPLTYAELLNDYHLPTVASWSFWGLGDLYADYHKSESQIASLFLASCKVARDAGAIIYTINLESPNSQALMESCAGTSSQPGNSAFAFNVVSSELVGTFESIASSIRKLKLVE